MCRCDELHIAIQASSGEEKQRLIIDQTEHNNKARMGYQTKIADKDAAIRSWRGKRRVVGGQTYRSKEGVDMLTFDFEQNLPTPMLKHNDVFYARQLWTYLIIWKCSGICIHIIELIRGRKAKVLNSAEKCRNDSSN